MEKMVLYTTGCPKCRILEKKLSEKENQKNRELYSFDMSTTEEGDTDNEQA